VTFGSLSVRGDLCLLEQSLWVLHHPTRLPAYDFDFQAVFECTHPFKRPAGISAVARVGAFQDYEQSYEALRQDGIALVHSPEEHLLASELPRWYPVLSDLTPKSLCFDDAPSAADVSASLGWPIFLKGSRQTSRHDRSLSIIDGPDAFERAMAAFKADPILAWQGVVCREYARLRPVEDPLPDRIPASFEFRTFWWRGELVGFGRYWWQASAYDATQTERRAAIEVAMEAAKRLPVAFLVVDVAQTVDGRWIVIECNDGQESGYAGVNALQMWRRMIDIERAR
jgi:hypothetical protein